MTTTTYSFSDVLLTFSHPSMGTYPVNGQGAGEISINYQDDNTAHSRAADGSVMVSKIKADNAQIAISIQQTSDFHRWLKNLFNFLNVSPASVWALATITVQVPINGEYITATGVSPQKRADQPYQEQGQNVTWNFMAASVNSV